MNRLKKTSGVYMVFFKYGKEIMGTYISMAVDMFNSQNNHLFALKSGKHYNPKMQRLYNRFDIDFKILEECPREKMVERKQYYMDRLKPNLNLLIKANSWEGYHHTDLSNKKNATKNYLKSKDPEIIKIVSKTWFKQGNQAAKKNKNV